MSQNVPKNVKSKIVPKNIPKKSQPQPINKSLGNTTNKKTKTVVPPQNSEKDKTSVKTLPRKAGISEVQKSKAQVPLRRKLASNAVSNSLSNSDANNKNIRVGSKSTVTNAAPRDLVLNKRGEKKFESSKTKENNIKEVPQLDSEESQKYSTFNKEKSDFIELPPSEPSSNTVSPVNSQLLNSNELNNSQKVLNATSSESIFVEPPSIRDADFEEVLELNVNDQNEERSHENTDYDLYEEDFEDYESDFEDYEDDESDHKDKDKDNESDHKDKDNDNHNANDISINNPIKMQNESKIISHSEDERDKNNSLIINSVDKSSLSEVSLNYDNRIVNKRLPINNLEMITAVTKRNFQINKRLKRGYELLEIIKLNQMSFTVYDSPPINYEIFIRTFGRRDAKQVSCQTNDRRDCDVQTDHINHHERWTQHPSISQINGGNYRDENNSVQQFKNLDPFKLSKFLTRAESIIEAVFQVEYVSDKSRSLPINAKSIALKHYVLRCSPLAKNCPVNFMFENSIYLFTVQNVTKIEGSAEKSVIQMWNICQKSRPERIFIARSHVTCAYAHVYLVIAGMIDGSVAVWDIREDTHFHKEMIIDNCKLTLRLPSYNTAGTGSGHEFNIIELTKLSFNDSDGERILQFATLDKSGIIIIWSVNELRKDNTDSLGSSPNSRIKLIKVTQIKTFKDQYNMNQFATSLKCNPNDSSEFFVGTDTGLVLRCSRHEEMSDSLPLEYSCNELNAMPSSVTSIAFNEYIETFLVGFSDGFICIYSINFSQPLFVWETTNNSIISIQWLPKRSLTFAALDKSDCILIYDLDKDELNPIIEYRSDNTVISSFTFCNGNEQSLALGNASGTVDLFTLNEHLTKPQNEHNLMSFEIN